MTAKIRIFAAFVVALFVVSSAEAAAPTHKIDVEIKTLCTLKGTNIIILNKGKKWPQAAKLRIYFADDKSPITMRKVKLGQGHSVSFNIKTKIAAGRPLGVYVEPTWYERNFEFDGTQKCA